MTIRLAGIDAAEMAQSPYGAQSRSLLAGLAPVGSDVSLRGLTTDRYGRTVAEILRGSQKVNLQMVRGGQAFTYRQYLSQCNAAGYLRAEYGAEYASRGVWSVPGGIERLWDFRHGRRGYRPATRLVHRPATETPPGGRHYRCREICSHARAQELLTISGPRLASVELKCLNCLLD